jgi:hypothetical protein
MSRASTLDIILLLLVENHHSWLKVAKHGRQLLNAFPVLFPSC